VTGDARLVPTRGRIAAFEGVKGTCGVDAGACFGLLKPGVENDFKVDDEGEGSTTERHESFE
jgi:hypothetical protein